MRAELREINDSNMEECLALTVSAEQVQYISPNADSLKEADGVPKIARPFALNVHDRMVGFAKFAIDEINEDPDKYRLWRFMIDEEFQGKGYGSAALEAIIEYFRENGADEITLSTKENNTAALGLYHKFGFSENGEMNGEETVLKKPL